MNIPGFTADASLYRTSGHYRTGRNIHAIHLPTRMIETIHPAAREEVIKLRGCAAGRRLVEYDDGTWDCLEEPWGGEGVGGTPGAPSGDGGGPGGGGASKPPKKSPKRPPRPPRPPKKVYAPKQGQPCHAVLTSTSGDVKVIEEIISMGDYNYGGPSLPEPQQGWYCSYSGSGGASEAHCNEVKGEGGWTKKIDCYNGYGEEGIPP